MSSYIYIVPIHINDFFWLKPLQSSIEHTFGLRTKRKELSIDLSAAFDPQRNQYNSSLILRQLITTPPADAFKLLGVTAVDLFIPILTFVFGEAQLDGIGALVSLHRLNNRFYGLPENKGLIVDRLAKESIHELGHTLGLIHCHQPHCVLNASTYVEDIDQKSAEFCAFCGGTIMAKKG